MDEAFRENGTPGVKVGEDQVNISDPVGNGMEEDGAEARANAVEAAEQKQKKQLKDMKREEYKFYKVKMLATVGITIVTYIVFFCLIKYLPGDADSATDANQAGTAP